MKARDPHYHLSVMQSANLSIKIRTTLLERDQTLHGWLKEHGVTCDPKKIKTPQSWRISYGMLHRIAKAFGSRTDRFYKELGQ